MSLCDFQVGRKRREYPLCHEEISESIFHPLSFNLMSLNLSIHDPKVAFLIGNLYTLGLLYQGEIQHSNNGRNHFN